MKRIITLLGVILLAYGTQAQQNEHSNYIGLNGGGAINSITQTPADGQWSMGWRALGELKYSHFFGKHFGLGFGVQYNIGQTNAMYNFTETSTGLTHVDNANVQYDLNTVFDNWHERQTLSFFSIPIELYWRANLSEKWAFLFGLGAQIDLPLAGKYSATEGSYRTEGYFPALGYTVSDLPDHGFRTFDADFESDIKLNKTGVSIIADLGFNYALANNWGLYIGLYGGYGLINMLDSASTAPILAINESDASQLDYNGTLASNQIDALNMFNAGVKIGINFGWNCARKIDGPDTVDYYLEQYDEPATKASDEGTTEDEVETLIEEQLVEEPVEEPMADEVKAVDVEETEQPAEEPVADDVETVDAEEIVEQPADNGNDDDSNKGNNNYSNNNYGNNNYGNNTPSEESAEEAAAREGRCDARRMNNPDMAQALSSIDADLDEAEQAAKEANSDAAMDAVADARAKAADAKAAYNNGKYCKAYDLFNGAYGDIADSYAYDAAAYASDNADAAKAADDAALYADAAHKDGLDCAMAASRNARLNSEIAKAPSSGSKANDAINDPNYADYLANEALAMADDANCKPARTDAKDASGKAYRGKLADSYAACASSFAKSANAYAAKSDNAEAKEAAAEAERLATVAAEAARMGDTAAAYRAARAAQQAAERARRLAMGGNDNAEAEPTGNAGNGNAPADKAKLQQYLDQINATVHFDFGSSEPKFDSKTDLAIRALCAAMKADSRVKILITGHTDNVGSAQGNMSYGKKRAEALKQLMVNQGAPASSIDTASKGQNEPVVDNDTEEHRYQNRRAVVTLR